MICTYPHCARYYGGCGCEPKVARGKPKATISASGLDITIACDDHDTKDEILAWLEAAMMTKNRKSKA